MSNIALISLSFAKTVRSNKPSSARAFTLIEILVVVLITGILATAVSLALFGRASASNLDDLVRRIAFIDSTVRHTARSSGRRQQIDVNLDQGLITSQDFAADPGVGREANTALGGWTQRLKLPSGFKIDHAWRMDGWPASKDSPTDQASIDNKTQGQSEGTITIPCSGNGYMPTYALSVAGPQGQHRWIVIVGLTGQSCIASDAKQVRSILSLQSDARASTSAIGAD